MAAGVARSNRVFLVIRKELEGEVIVGTVDEEAKPERYAKVVLDDVISRLTVDEPQWFEEDRGFLTEQECSIWEDERKKRVTSFFMSESGRYALVAVG